MPEESVTVGGGVGRGGGGGDGGGRRGCHSSSSSRGQLAASLAFRLRGGGDQWPRGAKQCADMSFTPHPHLPNPRSPRYSFKRTVRGKSRAYAVEKKRYAILQLLLSAELNNWSAKVGQTHKLKVFYWRDLFCVGCVNLVVSVENT